MPDSQSRTSIPSFPVTSPFTRSHSRLQLHLDRRQPLLVQLSARYAWNRVEEVHAPSEPLVRGEAVLNESIYIGFCQSFTFYGGGGGSEGGCGAGGVDTDDEGAGVFVAVSEVVSTLQSREMQSRGDWVRGWERRHGFRGEKCEAAYFFAPTTAASAISGCVSKDSCSSAGATCRPFTLISS